MKNSHFEVGVALGAAGAADQRDEPTQREPATFHRHAVGPPLVSLRLEIPLGKLSPDGVDQLVGAPKTPWKDHVLTQITEESFD